MVIYEWKDYQYLGKVTSETDDYLPVSGRAAPYPRHAHEPVSRRRTYAPPMLCEVASVIPPISVALFSICQLGSLSKTLHSGPQESRSLRAKEAPAETFRRVRPVSIPTLVPPVSSNIMNRYSISSAKPGIIALVCYFTVCERSGD